MATIENEIIPVAELTACQHYFPMVARPQSLPQKAIHLTAAGEGNIATTVKHGEKGKSSGHKSGVGQSLFGFYKRTILVHFFYCCELQGV